MKTGKLKTKLQTLLEKHMKTGETHEVKNKTNITEKYEN